MTSSINLNLEKNPSDYNRTLATFQNHLYAIGGDCGSISALSLDNNGSPSSGTARIIHQYDEPVRALAFSKDGQRVAVGYEDGNIDIYSFTAEELKESPQHPFLGNGNGNGNGNNKPQQPSDSQDDLDDMFTQGNDDDDGNANDLAKLSPSFRLAHRFESTIRSLQFNPPSPSSSHAYFLAIAAESAPGFMIANATSQSSFQKYLDADAEKEYNQGGVRNAAYAPDGSMVATLGCDGRLCIWAVHGDPELDWELVHRDGHKVVSKQDAGGFASSFDRSLAPVWSADGLMLGLPGAVDLQFRRNDGGANWFKKDRMVLASFGGGEGNTGEIVGMAFDPCNEGYVVTSSKDGKICVWKMNDNDNEVRK